MTGGILLAQASVTGVLAAGGLFCMATAVLPPAPMDRVAAFRRLHHPDHPALLDTAAPSGFLGRLLQRLTAWTGRRHHPWLGLPTADLDLLDLSAPSYVARRLAAGLAAAALGAVFMVLTTAAVGMPLAATATGPLVAAAAGSMIPVWQVRGRARRRRDAFRRVLASYLELTAQERAAGRAPTQALAEAAEVCDHPLFRRLRAALAHAARLGETPWPALRELADRLHLPELRDLADIAAVAATGAAIYATLNAQAAVLRDQARSDDIAAANAITERLTLPVSLLLVGFLGLVLYPTITRLIS